MPGRRLGEDRRSGRCASGDTGLLQLYGQIYDQYRYGDCQINIADDCGAGRVGGLTNTMVLSYGAFILVFRCCESCDLEARETAEVGYKLGVIEAHERLADLRPCHSHPG